MDFNPFVQWRQNLRIKLISLIIPIGIISLVLTSIYNFQEIYWPLFLFPTIALVLITVIVWFFLKPLERLSLGAQLFAKGELDHKIYIGSGDELDFIASDLNQMAQQLSNSFLNIKTDKEILDFEKNKLNSIISSISDGIIVLNLHRQVVFVNDIALILTGYKQDEILYKNIEEVVKFTNLDDQEIPLNTYCKMNLFPHEEPIPHQTFNSNQELNLIGKEGYKRSVRLNSSPINTPIKADLGCVLSIHDLAKEKELEALQLDFVSMASHELRTPLTSVIGYMSIFLDDNKEKLTPNQKEFLNRIFISAKQLSGIIENLLSVSKVERGALNSSMRALNWVENLTTTVSNNQIQATQKNITLTLDLPDKNLPYVMADSVRINEVLNNLISNAINYTKEGGTITVSAKFQANEVVTSVKDSGVGIPEEALKHLFTKFFRVSGAMDAASNSKGTGLGLYISKSIIDMHHGKIWAQSRVGAGSTFYFTLPIAPAIPQNFVHNFGMHP